MSAHPALLYPVVESVDDESALSRGFRSSRQRDHRDVLRERRSCGRRRPGLSLGRHTSSRCPPSVARLPQRAHACRASLGRCGTVDQVGSTARDPLTIAVEDWQPATSPTAHGGMPCGIAIVGDRRGAGSAVDRHDRTHTGCELLSPSDAEVVAVIAPALDQLDVADASIRAGRPTRRGTARLRAVIGPRCRTVWLLTADGERIHVDDTDVRPAQAALAAMHRSVGFEFGEQAFGSLTFAQAMSTRSARPPSSTCCSVSPA